MHAAGLQRQKVWMQREAGRRGSEAGFSLIEVLVACGLMALVLGALMEPLVLSQRIETRDTNYDFAQQSARTGLDSMVAQIRQATAVTPQSNTVVINVNLPVNGVDTAETVEYECDIQQPGSTTYHECLRVQTAEGGTLPPISTGEPVIQNLLNGTYASPVFTWGPDPNAPYYMTATIQVPSSNGSNIGFTHAITLSDGALMRNLNVGN
jgi:type II secretory pathway pseudopilin PulG